jgi:hypothetical protein
MHLIQLLLPVQDNACRPYPKALYDDVVRRLTERFGGVTAYTRAPAVGLWEAEPGATVRDQVMVYEVMVESLEREWWAGLRTMLEARFAQEELVIRAQAVEQL